MNRTMNGNNLNSKANSLGKPPLIILINFFEKLIYHSRKNGHFERVQKLIIEMINYSISIAEFVSHLTEIIGKPPSKMIPGLLSKNLAALNHAIFDEEIVMEQIIPLKEQLGPKLYEKHDGITLIRNYSPIQSTSGSQISSTSGTQTTVNSQETDLKDGIVQISAIAENDQQNVFLRMKNKKRPRLKTFLKPLNSLCEDKKEKRLKTQFECHPFSTTKKSTDENANCVEENTTKDNCDVTEMKKNMDPVISNYIKNAVELNLQSMFYQIISEKRRAQEYPLLTMDDIHQYFEFDDSRILQKKFLKLL